MKFSFGRFATRVLLGACCWVFLCNSAAKAQEASEYAIKAAMLYKIAKFVNWPDSAFASDDERIVLGILGRDPFGKEIDILENKSVRNRKIRIERYAHPQEIDKCHILFISASESARLANIIEHFKHRCVLTVSDSEPFIQNGGIVNFTIFNENIRFEINAAAAKQADLKISSLLLRLATNVKVE